LELEGERWIGKMSKLRSDWLIESSTFIKSNKIVLEHQYKENYMTLADMKGISRELVILNNSQAYHKNYHCCEANPNHLTMYSFMLEGKNKLMLRANYKHIKCYNSLMLIQKATSS
jgi:hypothetical protein